MFVIVPFVALFAPAIIRNPQSFFVALALWLFVGGFSVFLLPKFLCFVGVFGYRGELR
jgi:hypothetical protein